ncbi:hypothetical protein [Yersinia proxima]|uniref:hypothetical protein n=1 Tax=Yersinia proxima TaxID=2890316 RepID=UPI000980FCA5|nr:hypothetical protein [Yersinia proxima]
MELTTLNVTLMGAFGSLVGVCVSAFINWLIAKNNRSKSLNEWRREKLLTLIYDFLEQFKKDTTYNNKNAKDFDHSIIPEIAFKNYVLSDRKAHQLCLFLSKNESVEFLEKYNALKIMKVKETEKNFYIFVSGNHYEYFESRESTKEYTDVIELFATVIKNMN